MRPPCALTNDQWPPLYVSVFAWRQQQLKLLRNSPSLLRGAKEFYRSSPTGPIDFITHWVDTYDPRLAGSDRLARMPFILFQRQAELIEFLMACLRGEESGLIEKCRDMGATWVACALSIYLWLFWPGASIGWGSRKEQLVDKIGDPDSIFEKMRMIIRGLPPEFLPVGLKPSEHLTYMRFVNPENEATITGEAGDNIGRGGRKLIYFKDEAAYYERPEKIEAALADNTRVQIDISSVNGLGNVFHRRRESGVEWYPDREMEPGKTRVFVMDWREHPEKTQEWYDTRKRKATDDGLAHVFAQEVDRSYSAAVIGTIIKAEWVAAAVDAHLKLKFDDSGGWCAALDVSDGGGDTNALAKRKGVILKYLDEWGDVDTGVTTRRAISACDSLGAIELSYDCIGVGAGVKAESNRLIEDGSMPRSIRLVPWNAGSAVMHPEKHVIDGDRDTPINDDFFANLKAQAWWSLARRFERTWRAVNEPGFTWRPDDLISLPSNLPLLRKLQKELCQATASKGTRLKMVVDKAPSGTKSPNLADAVVMAFTPVTTGRVPIFTDAMLKAMGA